MQNGGPVGGLTFERFNNTINKRFTLSAGGRQGELEELYFVNNNRRN